ncbi:MAG: hypothetical protein NVS3B26_20840 [Mycobacteriales bacterium]
MRSRRAVRARPYRSGHNLAYVDLPPAVSAVITAALEVAHTQGKMACAALVGSWAAGSAGPASDIDLILLVEHPEHLLTSDAWYTMFGHGVSLIRQNDFGDVQERRLREPDGLVVEVNVGALHPLTQEPAGSWRMASFRCWTLRHDLTTCFGPEETGWR